MKGLAAAIMPVFVDFKPFRHPHFFRMPVGKIAEDNRKRLVFAPFISPYSGRKNVIFSLISVR